MSASSSTGSAVDSAMEKMFEQSFKKLDEADRRAQRTGEEVKTTSILGLEVPEVVGTIAKGLWNEGAEEFTKWLQPNSIKFFDSGADKIGLTGANKVRGVALATIGTTIAIKSGMYISPVFSAFKNQHIERVELARKVAPILDLDGSHSVTALMHSKNDMIRAHCERMTAHTHKGIKNALTELVVNVLPSMVLDLPDYNHLWRHGTHRTTALDSGESRIKNFVGRFIRVGASPVANTITHANDRAVRRKFSSPHSALEMVLALNEQAVDKPDANSFSMPGKGGRSTSMSLQAYIEEVIRQHQRDQADISHDQLEIRPALNAEVTAAAQALADAVSSSRISAMSLIQLIGGGAVVLRNGNAIADPAQIDDQINAISGKHVVQATTDTKLYFKEASFTLNDLKDALGKLEGETKTHFASMFPNEVLAEAGMGKKEIEQMRDATVGDYARSLCAVFLAIDAKSDEELKEGGLARYEISAIRKMAQEIERHQEQAVAKFKNNPGGNLLIPNWIVSHAMQFGTLRDEGMERLNALRDTPAASHKKPHAGDDTGHDRREPSTHLTRQSLRRAASHDMETVRE